LKVPFIFSRRLTEFGSCTQKFAFKNFIYSDVLADRVTHVNRMSVLIRSADHKAPLTL